MWEKELKTALEAAIIARKGIMEIYSTPFDVEIKDDNSPVTAADKGADAIIREYLSAKFPAYGMLTEESEDNKERLQKDCVWIVDPVDGTKDFVARDNEFTTNIALAYKGKVVVGVVSVPATKEIYFASSGNGSWYDDGQGHLTKNHVSSKIDEITMLTSRFHVTKEELKYIDEHKDKITNVETYGSAIKPCRIARGLAEVNLRLSAGTKEWDTAASQCVIEEAGGYFVKPDNTPMTYNRVDVYNREGYIVLNKLENNYLK